jgi:predicted helicase
LAEYERGWSIATAMSCNGDPAPGIVTTHDEFAISWSREEAVEKVERFLATSTEDEARAIWRLCSQDQWNYSRAKQELSTGEWRDHVVPILYRPFDTRWTVYDRNVAVHRRERVMNHMLRPNVALVTARSNKAPTPDHVFCATTIVETKCGESTTQSTTIPLWLYGMETGPLYTEGHDSRLPDYCREFLEYVDSKVGRVSPEDIFAYCYAVLYSPRYRTRYNAFLRRDFPRVPVTADAGLFRKLAVLGQRLVDLHVMRAFAGRGPTYPEPGTDRVDRWTWSDGCVYINAGQYFDGVSEVAWNYSIGGYQVAQKWLRDRKDRVLTFEDLEHYPRVIGALNETIQIQRDIDAVIGR